MSSGPRLDYKWVVLSNTTLAMLLYSLNQTIVLVALPAIFAGIRSDPLSGSGAGYLLWVMSGYTAVATVLLATFGRIADIHGKVRFYNIGFAIFGLGALLCALTPSTGDAGALELIVFRLIQGVGGAMLSATSFAILTDAFPSSQRGLAFAINQLAFIGGNVSGVILGGLLAAAHWRLVFLVSVPIAFGGVLWSYFQLKETGIRTADPPDWWGNLVFGLAMLLVMVALTYCLVPYRGASMGWGNPLVATAFVVGVALLGVFITVETKVDHPMFNLQLLRIRAFVAANLANFLFSLARGGLQFILIIWLQAVWLPLHGVTFSDLPLRAGLALLPMMLTFMAVAPVSGWLADRYGALALSTGGLCVIAVGLLLLATLPADFNMWFFGSYIALVGVGIGLFAAPNSTQLMGSVSARYRGIASGMRQTITNTGQLLSTALFLTVVITGLSTTLPGTLRVGLTGAGVPTSSAAAAANIPAGSALFAALLGYNPIERLLSGGLAGLPANVSARVASGRFFADLISEPLASWMHVAFVLGAAMALAGAVFSALRGPRVREEASSLRPATAQSSASPESSPAVPRP